MSNSLVRISLRLPGETMLTAKIPSLSLLFAGLIIVLMLGFSGAVQAEDYSNVDCNQMNQSFQSTMGRAGQEHLKIAKATHDLFMAINIEAMYCIAKIDALFQTLGTLGDPLGLIWNLIAGMILNYLNSLCQMVVSTVQQAISFVKSEISSLICLPLPQFGFGGGGISFPKAHCPSGSIGLLQMIPGPNVPPAPFTDPKTLFPSSSSSSGPVGH